MKISNFVVPAAMVALIMFFSIAANAQATRTWISGVGDDANPCSRTAPCKTWAGAIGKTATGGEIDALDPGGFGTVSINKSITLNGSATLGSTLASGTIGINVVAGATDIVKIRNLSINGAGTTLGTVGINFLGGGHLSVEGCDISNFSSSGILVGPNVTGRLTVKNTQLFNVTNGINVDPSSGLTFVSLDNISVQGGVSGLRVASNSTVTISNSVISNNTGAGISTSGGVEVNAESVKLSNNDTGILAGGTSTVRMSNLDIFNNVTAGIARTGTSSVLASFLNNKIRGNGLDGSPTVSLTQQ